MKSKLFLILVIFCLKNSYAQSFDESPEHPWIIEAPQEWQKIGGFSFTGGMAGLTWKQPENNDLFSKAPGVGMAFNLHYATSISPKFSLDLGFSYDRPTEKVFQYTTWEIASTRIKGSLTEAQVDSLMKKYPAEEFSIISRNYISIPVKLIFYPKEKFTKLFFTAGISVGYLPSLHVNRNTLFADQSRENVKYMEPLNQSSAYPLENRINIGFIAGGGYEHYFGENFILRFQPEVRIHSLANFISNYPTSNYFPWTVGLNTGFFYIIK